MDYSKVPGNSFVITDLDRPGIFFCWVFQVTGLSDLGSETLATVWRLLGTRSAARLSATANSFSYSAFEADQLLAIEQAAAQEERHYTDLLFQQHEDRGLGRAIDELRHLQDQDHEEYEYDFFGNYIGDQYPR